MLYAKSGKNEDECCTPNLERTRTNAVRQIWKERGRMLYAKSGKNEDECCTPNLERTRTNAVRQIWKERGRMLYTKSGKNEDECCTPNVIIYECVLYALRKHRYLDIQMCVRAVRNKSIYIKIVLRYCASCLGDMFTAIPTNRRRTAQ